MSILVIPDVHGRSFWREAVNKHGNECDKIIFLGDYCDPYDDEDITVSDTLNNFEDIIKFARENRDKVVLLLGNHCLHYVNENVGISTRYDEFRASKISKMYNENKDLFSLAAEENIGGKRFLFTHAGVMRSWYERNKKLIGDELTADNINKLLETNEGILTLSEISKFRTYFSSYKSGSPIWSDVRERALSDDEDVEGIDFQIFGHTMMKKEHIDKTWACLDCKKAFVINDDGTISES